MSYSKYIIFILLISFSLTPLMAREKARGDWSDLYAGERKYYGSEKEEKNATYAFFLEKENWEEHYKLMLFWLFKYTDFPRYNSLRLWPFYFSQKSKIDNRERSWGLGWPLLFYYHSIDGPEEFTLHIPVYFSSIKKNESYRSLFYLFWWGNEREERYGFNKSYVNILPFFFYKRSVNDANTNENSQLIFFPFLYRDYYANTSGNYSATDKLNITLLHYYHSNAKKETRGDISETTTWWFPLIPLTYHHTSPGGGHRNFLWFIDYSWRTTGKGDRLKRLWLTPLLFIKTGGNGYTHILPPLFMSFRESYGGYSHLLPFYFSWKGRETGYDYREKKTIYKNYDSFLSIFYSRFKKQKTGENDRGKFVSDTMWIGPFIPFIYYSSEDRGGIHRNVFWLFDWKRNTGGEMKRFWLIPLWFYGFGDKGYSHILPPLFMSFREKDGDYYRHLLPLFFSWKSSRNYFSYKEKTRVKTSYESNSFLSILYSRFTKKRSTGGSAPEIYSDTFWFGPFIPLLFYSSEDSDGIHRNMLWLIDWKKNPGGELERFWFIPLAFYKSGTGGYRHFFPFYLRFSGWSESRGSSLGIFHYHSWSKDENRIWIWPYYASFNLEKKTYFSFLLPFGVSWKTEKSSGDIFLPVLLNYQSRTRSYHVNILGLSRTAALGPAAPEVTLDIGKYRGNWYLDTDISWLYNAFSISTRLTLKNPFAKRRDISPDKLAGNSELTEELLAEKTGIVKKKTVSRENSQYFWGWNLLYGLVAFEIADSRRHFRLLPLSWLTWDKESDDKLFVIPLPIPIIRYLSIEDDSEYLVVFPFYGNQRQGKSYSRGYGFIAYWDEYDDETKLKEKTVLWPLFNWYSSPVKRGWRIFPLIWRKWRKDKGIVTSKYISLLHYSHYKTDEKDGSTLYKFIINPFTLAGKKVENEISSEWRIVPFLPLYYSSSRHFAGRTGNDPESRVSENKIKEWGEGRSFLIPFYYSTSSGEKRADGSMNENFSLLIPLTLFYYTGSRYTSREKEGNDVSEKSVTFKDYSLFILGFYFTREKYERGNNFLWGLIWNYRSNARTGFSQLDLLFGLLSFSSSSGSRRIRLLPFYYSESSPDTSESSLLLGLYKSYTGRSEEYSYLSLFWNLFRYSSFREAEVSSLTDYRSMKTKRKRSWLFPLYYYSGSSWEGGYKSTLHFSLLHYRSRESCQAEKGERYSSTFWFPLLPLFYRNESSRSPENRTVHWNILGLIDRKSTSDDSYSRGFFLPFFYSSSGTTGTGRGRFNFFALPVLLSGYSESPGSVSRMILGTYWHNSLSYERQNLYYLFDHRRYGKTHYRGERDIYNYLFTTVRYETSPQVTKFRMFWGALMSYKGYTGSDRYEFSILFNIINRERGRDFGYSHFFPFYYYKNYDDPGRGWYILSPVTLSYFSTDRGGDFDLGLLGIIYYRNNVTTTQKDRRMWLLGSLWNEVKRPERGYHSKGMLWGLLWEYETESETGFRKFSILKGLYKRVEYNGKTRHKFFWIF